METDCLPLRARDANSSEGLPVHRHFHHKASSVYAFQHEVDAWWKNRTVRSSEMQAAQSASFRPEFPSGATDREEYQAAK
jgi:hypothetical protein